MTIKCPPCNQTTYCGDKNSARFRQAIIPVKSPVFPGDSLILGARKPGSKLLFVAFYCPPVAHQLDLAELRSNMTETVEGRKAESPVFSARQVDRSGTLIG